MRSRIQQLCFLFSVWIYFTFFGKFHLLFTEGMQLFLFTRDYAADTCMQPGGTANYLSRFIVQFFHFPWPGALIIAFMLLALQFLVQKVASEKPGEHSGLSYIPSFFYLCLLADLTKYTITGLVSLLAALTAVLAYKHIRNTGYRALWGFISLPLLWYTMGGVAVLAALLMIVTELARKEQRRFLPLLAVITVGLTTVFAAPRIAPSLSDPALFYGANYLRFIEQWDLVLPTLWIATALVIICLKLVPSVQKQGYAVLVSVLIFLTGYFSLWRIHDTDREDILRCYFSIHKGHWNEVISRARKKMPVDVLTINGLNLALAATNQAGDCMFAFPQSPQTLSVFNTGEGLLFSAETLFNLGFINEAQRLSHEYMESAPDRQLSALLLAQMAETNLIAGRTAVAEKYLRLLEQTLFYKKAARGIMPLTRDPQLVRAHPFYGPLRKYQPAGNFSSDFSNLDNMLARMITEHPDNKMAVNYFFMYLMLHKNSEALHNLFPAVAPVPRHYQELIAWMQTMEPDNYPRYKDVTIDASVKTELNLLLSQIRRGNNSPASLGPQYAHTYWFYLLFM